MSKTLSVAAIHNGTVIDHIAAGKGLKIINLLRLLYGHYQITLGLNLPSNKLGKKDLIKIENYMLSESEASDIKILAPAATVNIIKNYEVIKKLITKIPQKIENIFVCTNKNCITQTEKISSMFFVHQQGKQVKLSCGYCEKSWNRDQITVANPC